jgi:hypothetical protein
MQTVFLFRVFRQHRPFTRRSDKEKLINDQFNGILSLAVPQSDLANRRGLN